MRLLILQLILLSGLFANVYSKDFKVTGQVTDAQGVPVQGAQVSMVAGTREYKAVSGANGFYTLNLTGIYSSISGLLEQGMAYPNPFMNSVHIPFIINADGDIRFSVYSVTGKKLSEHVFPGIRAGSYSLKWDGCNSGRSPLPRGLYIYAITFRGETFSGRLVKSSGDVSSGSGTSLEQVYRPSVPGNDQQIRVKTIASVSREDYFPLRLTDIVVRCDTVIDFKLGSFSNMPFRTLNGHIARHTGPGYREMILKGINLGSSPPGTFPGEIAYAIPAAHYEQWISRIGKAGFNSIRVYTLHPPIFYETLANYNARHRDKPIYLFQGVWLGETEDRYDPDEYDLVRRTGAFTGEIHEVTDCVHGKNSIAFRYGRAYGSYKTDVSEWIAGYIIGREIAPQEVDSTNRRNPSLTSYNGLQFTINGGKAADVFTARMLDEVVKYEKNTYGIHRPVSMSSWPTLDPLEHLTEIHTDEDKASIDIMKISGKADMAGLFATYHAYPYYPNFISQEPSYLTYSDSHGPNSYAGYLAAMKDHYSTIPLVIGEFGVPSSWGSAHWSYSNMDHGGYSETEQGERNMRLMHNILDAGCAGGFIFAWMDEWFKPTWIVQYLEAYGFNPGNGMIPTRQLWHNLTSPEQNFGLMGYEQVSVPPFTNYQGSFSSTPVSSISATHDNQYFHLNINLKDPVSIGDTIMIAFDTYSSSIGESVLPNGKHLSNRSEFVLRIVAGQETASHLVTEAYNMNGLTPRFNLASPEQKFQSVISDGAPWNLMEWINDGYEFKSGRIGILPVENSNDFTFGNRCAVAWNGNRVKVRMPWTLLHFYDPTQMTIVDGAVSTDGGWSFTVIPRKSDGISVSVYAGRKVVSATSRYNWDNWLVVPETRPKEKKSLQVVETGLSLIPDFIN